MADSLEKGLFHKELVASFKTLKDLGTTIVAQIGAAKNQVATDRAAILNSTLLTAEEKDAWRLEYNSRMVAIKDAITAALV